MMSAILYITKGGGMSFEEKNTWIHGAIAVVCLVTIFGQTPVSETHPSNRC